MRNENGRAVIAIDAMGGDFAPDSVIDGAIRQAGSTNAQIVLVGDEGIVSAKLKSKGYSGKDISIVHASQVITGDDVPTVAIKGKKDSSMSVGLNMLKAGNADAFISAGNTGALLAGATLIVGRLKGVERPAIACALPNEKKGFTLLLDCGANAEVKPQYLLQFGQIGSVYCEYVLGIKNPRVGLINIGTEKEKGTTTVKEAHDLLAASNLNFIGNTEASDVPTGKADVLVCDGFTGNIILKHTEGLSRSILGIVKEELMSTTLSKIGALLAKGAFANIKKRFDYKEIGGAPLLGLKKLVVKAHGSSDAKAIAGAIRQCASFTQNDIVRRTEERL